MTMLKAFECVDHNKLRNILQEMRIADHITFLLKNLYAGQKTTVKTGHGTTDWFHIGKVLSQGCVQTLWQNASYGRTLSLSRETRLQAHL